MVEIDIKLIVFVIVSIIIVKFVQFHLMYKLAIYILLDLYYYHIDQLIELGIFCLGFELCNI